MKKSLSVFLLTCFLASMLSSIVLAADDAVLGAEKESMTFERLKAISYAQVYGWQIPKYEPGWKALETKVRALDKFHLNETQASYGDPCPWIRPRDGALFEGMWVRTSYDSKVCLPPGNSKKDVRSVALSNTPVTIDVIPEPVCTPSAASDCSWVKDHCVRYSSHHHVCIQWTYERVCATPAVTCE